MTALGHLASVGPWRAAGRHVVRAASIRHPLGMPTFASFEATTEGWSLEDVVAHLAQVPAVHAVVALGSTAGERAAWSDLDLLVVLDGEREFDVEFTYVASTPTDVILVSPAQLERIADPRGGAPTGFDADLTRWLAAGRLLTRRTAATEDLLRRVAEGSRRAGPTREEQFGRWVEANFQRAKFRRYAEAGDPAYRDALDLALCEAVPNLVRDFLCFRGHAWEGEKVAWERVREDAVFEAALRGALRAAGPEERLRHVDVLTERACEPVGGTWRARTTAGGWNLDSTDPRSSSRWEALFAPAG